MDSPIRHFHVKIIKIQKRGDETWVKVMHPTSHTAWMPFPNRQMRPEVGYSGTVYAFDPNSPVGKMFDMMLNNGATDAQINQFVRMIAEQFDEWCEIPFEVVKRAYEDRLRAEGKPLPKPPPEQDDEWEVKKRNLRKKPNPFAIKGWDTVVVAFDDKGEEMELDPQFTALFDNIKFH